MRTDVDARTTGLTRRAVLGATGLVAVATVGGCRWGGDTPAKPPAPDPLAAFLAGTVALAERYDAAVTAHPDLAGRLTPIRDDHRAHAAALTAEIDPTSARPSTSANPSPTEAASSVPSDPATLLSGLRSAEQAAHRDAVAACLAARTPRRAALLGSIAACRATHVEALA
ncbi:MAG TPA: hypothetical protein VF054_10635 [Micromonosporaceae bacterium]